MELFRTEVAEPWWRGRSRRFRFARPGELPAGYTCGYVFETAIIETGNYLPYLMRRFEQLGGEIVQREIQSLADALREASAVVNCAGLGTLSFLPDKELFPIRGQIIRVAKLPLDCALLDDEEDDAGGIAYIVPRSNDAILGGTALTGNWSLEPDAATAQHILDRGARSRPKSGPPKSSSTLSASDPARSAVCLKKYTLPGGGTVVHNYGHGGAGVTLSWGCAEEVVRLL